MNSAEICKLIDQKEKISIKESIFKSKDELIIFEIKTNCSANVIKRKLDELKQIEKDLEEIKKQEELLWECLIEEWDTLQKLEELKQWLEKNTIKHIVKKWDTLWSICEKYYKHWAYSKILTDKLWYKTLIIPNEELYLPSKKWIKKLKLEANNNKTQTENENIKNDQDPSK